MDELTTTQELGAKANTKSIRLDVNRSVRGKAKNKYKLHKNFHTETVSMEEHARIIQAGHAVTAPFAKIPDNTHWTCHYKENVLEVTLLKLDAESEDELSTLDYWKNEPFVRDNATFIHTTTSHTPDAPRSRVLFWLEEALDVEEAEIAEKALFRLYPHVDQSVYDAGRVIYGAPGCELEVLGHVLSLDVLRERIIAPYKEHLEAEKRRLEEAGERQLASMERTPGPATNTSQVANYVKGFLESVITQVENKRQPGRYKKVRDAGVCYWSFWKSHWLDDEARSLMANFDFENKLVAAADTNGVLAEEGEKHIRDAIRSGERVALPRPEPVWKQPSDFFAEGDFVLCSSLNTSVGQTRGTITRVKKCQDTNTWLFELDTKPRVWLPGDWLEHANEDEEEDDESADGDTNYVDLEPSEAPKRVLSDETTGKPPPPENWPDDEALASDFFATVEVAQSPVDEQEELDVAIVETDIEQPEVKDELVEALFERSKGLQCTCKNKGTYIDIHEDFTTGRPNNNNDRRKCPVHRQKNAYRFTRQVAIEQKDKPLTMTRFATVEDWKTTNAKWRQWKKRQKDEVAFRPFVQQDGGVVVIHNSQDESDKGEALPQDDIELLDVIADILANEHETKRSRASSGFGGHYAGTRGNSNKDDTEAYRLQCKAPSSYVFKKAFDVKTNTFGFARVDMDCGAAFLRLTDFRNQELQNGRDIQLEERFPQGMDNAVARKIYEDEEVKEALALYRNWEEANASGVQVSRLMHNSNKDILCNKRDSQVVEEQLTLVFETTATDENAVLIPEGQPPPANAPPEDEHEDCLDWYLETIANEGW